MRNTRGAEAAQAAMPKVPVLQLALLTVITLAVAGCRAAPSASVSGAPDFALFSIINVQRTDSPSMDMLPAHQQQQKKPCMKHKK